MTEPARHLRLIDEHGEIVGDGCPNCAAIEDQLAGVEKEIRAWRARYANLKREIEGEVDTDHKQFPQAIALWRYYQERCNHPRAEFTADRMKIVLPFLNRHGPGPCREAIRGAAYDPYTTTLKNGSTQRHDGWDLIFRTEDKFQTFRARAPNPPQPTISQQTLIDHANDIASRCLERARLFEKADDPVAASHFLIEVNRLITQWLALPAKEDS